MTITLSPNGQVTVSPAYVTFTPTDWELPKAFTIGAVDDQVTEGPHTGNVSHAAAGTDARFNNFATGALVANIADNDENHTSSATDDQATTAEDRGDDQCIGQRLRPRWGRAPGQRRDSACRRGISSDHGWRAGRLIRAGGRLQWPARIHLHHLRRPRRDRHRDGDGDGHAGERRSEHHQRCREHHAPNPVVVSVLANDSDVDGDDLSVSAVTQPANGTPRSPAVGRR